METVEKARRKIIGFNDYLCEFREWDSAYVFAKEMGVSAPAVVQCMNRFGVCQGWKLYDEEHIIEERIKTLQAQIVELNELRKEYGNPKRRY